MDFLLEGFWQGMGLLFSLDAEVWGIAWVSMRVSLGAVGAAGLLGLPLGFVLAQARFPGKRLVTVSVNTLMALPTVVIGLVVYGLLSAKGPLGDWGLLYTPSAMAFAQGILALPLITGLTMAAVATLDRRVALTALTLGASRTQAAWLVLKEARLALLAALAAAFGRVVTEVGAAIMVGGNIRGYTRTLTTAIALETAKGEFAQGMALGLILLALALSVNALADLLRGRLK